MVTLLFLATESQCEGAHESDELFRGEVFLSEKTLRDKAASMALSTVLDGVTLILDLIPSHLEDHGGTTAVLDSCVSAELKQVSSRERVSDVIASLLNLLNLLDNEAELLALSNGKLVGQEYRA